MGEYVLEAKGIVKTFPGVRALGGVDFAVKKGEVHALVGENGAGKSTLMMVLGGVYKPDEGALFIDNEQVSFESARDSLKRGIGIVFQELSLVQQLSVAENIFANRQPVNRWGMVDYRKLYEQTKEMLRTFEIENIDPKTLVRDLSIANQQVVEILKAMSEKPKVIVLDEPTSSLTEIEVKQLFKNIRKLKEGGIAFIYISHHLSEIFEIADTVTVLRDGMKVASSAVRDIDEEFIVSNMVGRNIENIYGRRDESELVGDVLFEAKNLSSEGVFKDVSFYIREGEIVGFSGLVGAGRTEVARAIFGVDALSGGEMFLGGRKLSYKNCGEAVKQGVAYMTEDRKKLGLYLTFDIRKNLAANRLKQFTRGIMLDEAKLNAASDESVKNFGVVTPSIQQIVGNLSGGNQQKVLLAAWVGIEPRLLIVDEPTRGVDVGAKCDIYVLLRRLAKELKCAIMMVSSDLPEILGLSDRIYVMKNGGIVGELAGDEASEHSVIKLAAGS